ncbi:MAG: TolC family protein [Desulfosalsimonadaceae bacterium]
MHFKYLFFLFCTLSLAGFGDASYGNAALADPHSQTAPDNPAIENPTGPLSLNKALSLGLLQNPELSAFSWEIRSAEARAIQAGLFPNPELETSVENFGGENDQSGFKGAETTVQINQLIELGGKRLKRKQLADLETELAAWDFESKRLDVFADISGAFWDVFAAQESLSITRELSKLSEATYATVVERVKAGKVPPVEALQANVSLTTARIELEQARYTLEAARKRLAATWGSADPIFETVTGQMDLISPVPELAELEKGIVKNPDVARWTTEIENKSAAVTLTDAEAIPDVTIGAGPRYSGETDDTAFVMALSVPIPLFNRNQGAKQEARHGLSRAKETQRAEILKARSNLGQAYQELSAAFSSASALRESAMPAAETAFKSTLEGYREGKFSYPFVLEAQRTLFEVRQQHLLALGEYHKAQTAIERLTARPMP